LTDGLRDSRDASDLASRYGVGGAVSRWAEDILAMPVAARFALALASMAVVAVLDAVTGTEISFSVFYLVPVAFAGAFVSRRAGWAVALMSAVVWGYLDAVSGHGYSAAWILYWNGGVRLAFFLIVNELISMLRSVQAHLHELSRTDSLTRLANARVFQEHAERVIALSRRSGKPFTITYVDLDRFKKVNDEYGHSEGDRLLRAVAAHIEGALRATDVVARLGGDEFGILMPETGEAEAGKSLQRVSDAIASDFEGHEAVGATFGAITFDSPPDDYDSAVRQADALMYRGKEQGGGRIVQASWCGSGADAAERVRPAAATD
jgi:diguanylate cyclase (GGDEF)-like protein